MEALTRGEEIIKKRKKANFPIYSSCVREEEKISGFPSGIKGLFTWIESNWRIVGFWKEKNKIKKTGFFFSRLILPPSGIKHSSKLLTSLGRANNEKKKKNKKRREKKVCDFSFYIKILHTDTHTHTNSIREIEGFTSFIDCTWIQPSVDNGNDVSARFTNSFECERSFSQHRHTSCVPLYRAFYPFDTFRHPTLVEK